MCNKDLQDHAERVQEPGGLRGRRSQVLQGRVQEEQPQEGDPHLGREGDSQPQQVSWIFFYHKYNDLEKKYIEL